MAKLKTRQGSMSVDYMWHYATTIEAGPKEICRVLEVLARTERDPFLIRRSQNNDSWLIIFNEIPIRGKPDTIAKLRKENLLE